MSLEGNVLIGANAAGGAVRTRWTLRDPVFGHLGLLDGLILVPTGGRDGRLLAYAVGETEPSWEARLDSPLRTDVFTVEGNAVVQAADGRVMGLHPRREEASRH